MPSATGSGTQTATVGTEHTLVDVATGGIFVLVVDKNAMVAGDILELRAYVIVLTGGTRRVTLYQQFLGVQATDDKIAIFDPIPNELTDAGSVRFTLKQTAGTSRNFPWKVLSV